MSKIRIYPDKEQRVQIEKTIGCSRFIYNQMLGRTRSAITRKKKDAQEHTGRI